MSTDLFSPTIAQWVQAHVTAILQAQTQDSLQSAIDAFLSKDANVVVNGTHISRDAYAKRLTGQHVDGQSVTVNFVNAVAVPTSPDDNVTAGSVGVVYTANILNSRFQGAPMKKVSASLNVAIAQDRSIPKPSGSTGSIDLRRVTSLNEVVMTTSKNYTVTPTFQ